MVLLAITPSVLEDAPRPGESGETAIWCGSDAISGEEYAKLNHTNVSRFVNGLAGEGQDVLAGAIETVEEHYPNQTVWAEKCTWALKGTSIGPATAERAPTIFLNKVRR